ncbi:MAG: thioredoxin fold domain-containing protein [Bacteroidales bacterium]|nr:thioredoxin fold domain-containing protein [Bacteroidales bacterium]
MKKLIFALALVFSFIANETAFAQEINKQQFLEKVYNFEKNPQKWVYEGTLPCIVDFYADWCGPCKALSPRLAKMSEEFKGKIIIYKVNVDKEKELARAFGINSIPALLWCPAKGEPHFTQGAISEEELRKRIEEALLKK